MILPQRNAKLLEVGRGGRSEDYDTSEADDPSVWEGSVDAYFGRRRANMTEGAALNRTQLSYVIVPGDLGIEFRTGDTLTLEQNGSVWNEKVREFNDRSVAGLPPQPIRLDLEPR